MKKAITLGLVVVMASSFIVGCTPSKPSVPNKPGIEQEVGKEVDLKDIKDQIKAELEEAYTPDVELLKSDLAGLVNVDEAIIEDFVAEMPMMSVHVDMFIAVKAVEGKADEVERALEIYRKTHIDNSMQYPMNMAKVQASEVIREGDYVFFIMLGEYDERQDVTEKQALEFATEQTQKIVKVILDNFKK